MYFFADSYHEGRSKLQEVCNRANLKIDTIINPNAVSPSGEELVMDVVWCGKESAKRVLLVTSGTHGLEAAPGSATIIQWLYSNSHLELPDDVAVMIVHGVNAYGWAHGSRNNEDNIDLNRNFLDHSEQKPINSAYEELHDQVLRSEISNHGLSDSIGIYHQYAKEHGANNAIHGITGGQYTHADGISYGGSSLSWSFSTLLRQVKDRLSNAEKVVVIDWHTGIGEFAQPFFILKEDKDTEYYRLAEEWWGEEHIHSDDIFSDVDNPDYTGLLLDGLKKEIKKLNGADVLATTIEWGTFGLDSMIQALMMDRWLRFDDPDPSSEKSIQLKSRLIERFYPSMIEWRNSVLMHSERIYTESLLGLHKW